MALTMRQEQALAIVIAETVREMGEVPAGHLFAGLMDRMSATEFEAVIAMLVHAKLIWRGNNHLLVWVGPFKGAVQA